MYRIRDAIRNIPLDMLDRVVRDFVRRLQECIARRSWWIPTRMKGGNLRTPPALPPFPLEEERGRLTLSSLQNHTRWITD
uniref:Uncharacterized protein n=1 Tax=Timema poppense TaxID=170557 RepID=A0A7R9CPE2_TIMPO|nr:unnamed protein product [Timema poppensis]